MRMSELCIYERPRWCDDVFQLFRNILSGHQWNYCTVNMIFFEYQSIQTNMDQYACDTPNSFYFLSPFLLTLD